MPPTLVCSIIHVPGDRESRAESLYQLKDRSITKKNELKTATDDSLIISVKNKFDIVDF